MASPLVSLSKTKDEHWQKTTREAVSSIFFPSKDSHQSVLLKRGPVLVDGEEMELMLFTNGLVLSRVGLDALVELLLDATSGRARIITSEEVQERFGDIDADKNGCEFALTFGSLYLPDVVHT